MKFTGCIWFQPKSTGKCLGVPTENCMIYCRSKLKNMSFFFAISPEPHEMFSRERPQNVRFISLESKEASGEGLEELENGPDFLSHFWWYSNTSTRFRNTKVHTV